MRLQIAIFTRTAFLGMLYSLFHRRCGQGPTYFQYYSLSFPVRLKVLYQK